MLPYLIGGGRRRSDGYSIERSLLCDGSSHLGHTPASAGNRRRWTWSAWVKLGPDLSGSRILFSAGTSLGTRTTCYFAAESLGWQQVQNGSSTHHGRFSNAVLRDPSAFYHLIFVADTDNATAEDRAQIWVNGKRLTRWSSTTDGAPFDTYINNNETHRLCAWAHLETQKFDGYLAEVHFVDGQALTADDFGQPHPTVPQFWTPKKYTGAYGTNGFYLPLNNNASTTTLGEDASGNGNNWTLTGFTLDDSVTDTPRNNHCTWNFLSAGASLGATLAEGNLASGETSGSGRDLWGTIALTESAHYWEITAGTEGSGASLSLGISEEPTDANNVRYQSNGNVIASGLSGIAGTGSFASFTTGDVIGMAYDPSNGSLAFYQNGTLQTTVTWTGDATLSPYLSGFNFAAVANFGQKPFAHTTPTGFKALSTKNLPEPLIPNPKLFFDTLLWDGNGSTQDVGGLSFQPDKVWAKGRNNVGDHLLADNVSGASKSLQPNTIQPAIDPDTNGLTSFNSDGFSVGSATRVNGSGNNYAAWNWKRGVTPGFDIVSYTGDGVAGRTVAHGLGVPPAMMIIKGLDSALGWIVYHQSLGPTSSLALNLTDAENPAVFHWNDTAPTSTVFTVGAGSRSNSNNENYINYLFAEVPGFSAFFFYNGSTNLPFIHLGFKARWVMIKRIDAADDWVIIDTARDTANVRDSALFANSASSETSNGFYDLDVLANGLKPRSTQTPLNANGGQYIGMAMAEAPFKYSNAA